MADNELVRVINDNEARVNVTWQGQNGELPDPVFFDSTDGDVRGWVTEAVRNGTIPGIRADANADFHDYIVDRFPPNEARPYNLLQIRPKTAYGAKCVRCCWHVAEGALLMVIRPGHRVQTCCKCDATQQVHRDHL